MESLKEKECADFINLKDLRLSKQSSSSQSGQFFLQDAYIQEKNSSQLREKRQQKARLGSSAQHCRRISSIVADSRQRNKDLKLCGKNRFSILYRKIGTDHTLTVNPVLIRGEPILSISALKVPLCRQRFLRICPLYLSHTERIKKKAVKEMTVTLFPGSKIAVVSIVLVFTAFTLVTNCVRAQKKLEIQNNRHQLEIVKKHLDEQNKLEIAGSRI